MDKAAKKASKKLAAKTSIDADKIRAGLETIEKYTEAGVYAALGAEDKAD